MSVGLGDLNRLTESGEPRPPGSAAERRLANLVAERLDELGVPHTILHFRTVRGPATLYFVPLIGLILSILAAALVPLIGFILAALSALLIVLEATTRPVISRLFRLDSSQNVVGLVPHRPTSGAPDDEPRRRVVVTAHLDSPRSGWLDLPQLARYAHWLTIVTLVSVVGIPVALAINLFVDNALPIVLGAVLALVILAALILIMQRDLAGEELPGRNNNISGIATALALADELNRYPPLTVETLFIFTGASQSGSTGMTDFLAENRFNPERTYFINLESVGRGPICFTRAEGPLMALQSSPALVQISGDIALTHPQRLMRPIVHRGRPTDQYAAQIRGYQAITLMGHPDPSTSTGPPAAIENDEVDPEGLEAAYILVQGIVRRLDDEAAATDSPNAATQA